MENQNKAIYSSTQKTSRTHILTFLLLPSALGISIYVLIFVLTLVISQPSQYKTALSGFNVNDFQGTTVHNLFSDFTKAINSQIVNDIAIYVFWVVIAFGVYVIANRIIKNATELAEDFSLRQYIWPKNENKNSPIREFIEKIVFHTVVLIALILYLFKATPFIFDLWKKFHISSDLKIHNLELILILFVSELIFLHIIVILVRLFLTRDRIIKF